MQKKTFLKQKRLNMTKKIDRFANANIALSPACSHTSQHSRQAKELNFSRILFIESLFILTKNILWKI